MTQRDKVLARLKHGDWVSNGEFAFEMRILRYGAIIHELRKEGYNITTRNLKGSKYEFRLEDNPLFATPIKHKEYLH